MQHSINFSWPNSKECNQFTSIFYSVQKLAPLRETRSDENKWLKSSPGDERRSLLFGAHRFRRKVCFTIVAVFRLWYQLYCSSHTRPGVLVMKSEQRRLESLQRQGMKQVTAADYSTVSKGDGLKEGIQKDTRGCWRPPHCFCLCRFNPKNMKDPEMLTACEGMFGSKHKSNERWGLRKPCVFFSIFPVWPTYQSCKALMADSYRPTAAMRCHTVKQPALYNMLANS